MAKKKANYKTWVISNNLFWDQIIFICCSPEHIDEALSDYDHWITSADLSITIELWQFSKLRDEEDWMDFYILYLRDGKDIPTLAHEILHCIDAICVYRWIKRDPEGVSETQAYMMSHYMNQCLSIISKP